MKTKLLFAILGIVLFAACSKNDNGGGGTDPAALATKIKSYQSIIDANYIGDTSYAWDFYLPGANGNNTGLNIMPSFLQTSTPFVWVDNSSLQIGPTWSISAKDSINTPDNTLHSLFSMYPGANDGQIHVQWMDFSIRPLDTHNTKDYILEQFNNVSNRLTIKIYYLNAQNQKVYFDLSFLNTK